MDVDYWCSCEQCKKFYAKPRREVLVRTGEKPIRCPEGHVLEYCSDSVAWQRLTAIYDLLQSRYVAVPKVISFAQYQSVGSIIDALKTLE